MWQGCGLESWSRHGVDNPAGLRCWLEPCGGSARSLRPVPRARAGAPDARALGADEARALAGELAAALAARELQLERKQQEVAAMHDVQQRLMARNEELVRKAAAVSEEDMDAVRAECEARLGAAERKARRPTPR